MSLEILTAIAFLTILATYILWQSKRPEKQKEKFLRSLLHSTPIEPKHNGPKHIGGEFESLTDDDDRRFFNDFAAFGNVVNGWLSDAQFGVPWRLQELPETELRLAISDSPKFGRRYQIFYNQEQIGELEVSAGYPYTPTVRNVYANLELDWVRFLSFSRLTGFLHDIASHIQTDGSHLAMQNSIHHAIMEAMWRSVQIHEYDLGTDYGQLELQLAGTADWYFRKKKG
jgi:hypothetical protein